MAPPAAARACSPGAFSRGRPPPAGARSPVVDEGQDFEQEWFETVKLFLADGADILWLEDPDQNLLGRPPVVTESFVGYRALINYRTPDSIARHIRQTLPFGF